MAEKEGTTYLLLPIGIDLRALVIILSSGQTGGSIRVKMARRHLLLALYRREMSVSTSAVSELNRP